MTTLAGTLNRSGFLLRSIAIFVLSYCALVAAWDISSSNNGWTWWKYSAFYLFLGLLAIYGLLIIAKRLRDIGLSGWLALVFIPFPYVWPVLFFIPAKAKKSPIR